MSNANGGPQSVKLILGLSGRSIVVDVAPGTEVLLGLSWTEVAGLKPWVRGVALHKQDLVTVVDLSDLLDAEPLRGAVAKNRIISMAAGGFRTGFLVASVEPLAADDLAAGGQWTDLDVVDLHATCLDMLADPHAATVALCA